jgi:hypothetical protein
VNFDAGKHASGVCPHAGQGFETELPEQVRLSVIPKSVQSG